MEKMLFTQIVGVGFLESVEDSVAIAMTKQLLFFFVVANVSTTISGEKRNFNERK